jgi:predicted Zn-dependent protease
MSLRSVRPLVSLVALLAATAIASACARNPVTGKQQVIFMSEETEERIDEENARLVEAQLGLVEDLELTAYVNEVGQALATHSPRQNVRYRFHVVKMDEPNAFALPGGHIYISRGLLALTSSEAELAGVLGHEIGHVAARHAAQRDTLQKIMQVMDTIAMVGVAVGGATYNGNGGPMGNPALFGYSRKQESEADVISQDLAVQAGIDPMGMAQLLRSLDASTRLEQGYSRSTGYFDSHPAARERAAEAATAAAVRRWKPGFAIARTEAEYLDKIKGLSIGTPAAEGVVKDNRFQHADLGVSLRFPSGWKVENTHTAVVGVAPGRDAVVLLELEGEGDDPEAAAMGYAQSEGVQFITSGSVQISGLDAYRARGEIQSLAGRTLADITWIAKDGFIFRLTGFGVRRGGFARYEGVFRAFPRGFKPLTDSEREGIDELRLDVVRAKEGETLAQLGERTENAWEVNRTAVVNQKRPGEVLKAGEMVKIAIRVPYYAKQAGGHEKRDPRTPSDPEQHSPEDEATGPVADRSAEDDELDSAPAELH